jgi:hypothetical protein
MSGMDEEAMPRRIIYVTPMTTENRETKSTLEGGSWKGCDNVRNKELVVYSYEQRRMEATFKGGQDSYRVVESMLMMMRRPIARLSKCIPTTIQQSSK